MKKTLKYFKNQKKKLLNKSSTNTKKIITNLEKQEKMLLDKSEKCKRTKCSKLYKEKEAENKIFVKEQDIKCPKKLSNNEFYDCSILFYNNNPHLKQKYNEFMKCGDMKCKHVTKKRKELNNKIQKHYMKLFS
jgi:hypothetical protein